ncbi:MAG: peptide chain release factor N(5)-glutamine methyltransferase [Chlamydiota bacterium]|nr:peptide chain release factor N(5)-glutamine methyltransferase [Chlamydiota bacterium]
MQNSRNSLPSLLAEAENIKEGMALLAPLLNLPEVSLLMEPEISLSDSLVSLYRERVQRRREGVPLIYILGEMEFLGCELAITPEVLIPRPETEILAERVISASPTQGVWDLCCGSGCLGLSIKKALPTIEVVLSDISPEAVDLAKRNAKRNGLAVEVREGDLFAPFSGERVGCIVANPPYVSPEEYAALPPSVFHHEPMGALLAEEGGLLFYRRMREELPSYLHPGGRFYAEIGAGQGEALLSFFSDRHWKAPRLSQDWAGKDRFFSVTYSP